MLSEERGRMAVSIVPSDGQTAESVRADFEGSFRFAERLDADGTESWRSHFRRVGPLKVMVAKEVGPPAWRFPRVICKGKREPWFLSVAVGWRMTAYRLHVLFPPILQGEETP